MAKLSDIRDKYEEELFKNEITGVIHGKVPEVKADTPIEIELIDVSDIQAIFRYKDGDSYSTINITDLSKDMTAGFCVFRDINHIFWLWNVDGDKCLIKFLPCGKGICFETGLDIGYGDSFIYSRGSAKVEKIPAYLKQDFTFSSDFGDYLIIETYPSSETQITLHGLTYAADIDVKEHRYILRKQRRKALGNLSNFEGYNLVRYTTVSFVDESKAKAVLERIKGKSVKGDALIALWKKYSDIELRFAQELANELGDIHFTEVKYLSEHDKSLKLRLSDDQANSFKEHRDELRNVSVQLADKVKGDSYKIKSLYQKYGTWYMDVVDEDDTLPTSGTLSISTKGDEAVNKRREIARKEIENKASALLQNLRFAIEGEADTMLELRWRKEKPLTERTRKFLKERFGVSSLTPNQEEAIEIAINTPDLCIIQGPPGTGKSTVIAAICDRLIEIAEKEIKKAKKKGKDQNVSKKQILLSAFQNDTVEHIASKVETLGLPTLKIGKESVLTPAEDLLIERIREKIDGALMYLSGSVESKRYSVELRKIKELYEKERDITQLRKSIERIISLANISEILLSEWKEICVDLSPSSVKKDRQIKVLRNLSTDIDTYNDSGYSECLKVKRSGLPFTEAELCLLESAPDENPSEEFLTELINLKEKYLKSLEDDNNSLSNGLNLEILNWLDEFITFTQEVEENSYQDFEVFMTSVLENLRDDLDGNTAYIRDAIRIYSESLAATNQKAGGMDVESVKFDSVVLEEAARSNPLDLLIPMTRALSRVILVGDQKQLPQLIETKIVNEALTDIAESTDRELKRKSYEESLFGVIYKNLQNVSPIRYIRLNEQFRMHPVIGNFISNTYYEGNLKTGMEDQEDKRRHGLSIPGLKDKVMVFCDVNDKQGSESKGKGKSRSAEATRAISLVKEILADPESSNLSIGIITFYALQRDKIFEEAERNGLVERKNNGDYEITESLRVTSDGREKLRIGTVDSFQGKEFDVVILSTVRSNDINCTDSLALKKYGFLTLENRLNVAFSRAQRLLIVCGDGKMFDNDFAKKYVEGLYEFYVNQSTNEQYGARIN